MSFWYDKIEQNMRLQPLTFVFIANTKYEKIINYFLGGLCGSNFV